MKQVSKLNRAFTLIELLTVIAIIVILAGLLLPAIKSASTKAEVSKAQAGISGLATALRSYYAEYGHWPITYSIATPPYEDFIIDEQTVALLSGDDVGSPTSKYPTPQAPRVDITPFNPPYNNRSANAVIQGNPRKIVFLEFRTKDLDSSGYFVDPWGKPYHFRLDVNYKNEVEYPFAAAGSTLPGVGFLIWSPGPDGQYSEGDVVNTVSPLVLTSQDPKNKDNVRSW